MNQSDASLIKAIAKATERWQRCTDDFSAQMLANTAWVFATAGRSDVYLFRA